DRWRGAVDATVGDEQNEAKVLTYGAGGLSRLVTAYYFSSSGGQTENSEDVWVSTLSYLRSVPDPYSIDASANNSYREWTDTVSQSQARTAFGLSSVVSIRIVARTSSAETAAVTIVEATSSDGKKARISGAENIRIKLGLPSSWVWEIE